MGVLTDQVAVRSYGNVLVAIASPTGWPMKTFSYRIGGETTRTSHSWSPFVDGSRTAAGNCDQS
jgi:hypothetical protein